MNTPSSIASVISSCLTSQVAPQRAIGCCRVYVVISEKAARPLVKAACQISGAMYLKDAHGTSGNAIYVGYDNCRGDVLARGAVLVKALQDVGVVCYRDEVGD